MKSTEVAWRLVVGCAGRLACVVVGSCGGVNWWAGGLVGLMPRLLGGLMGWRAGGLAGWRAGGWCHGGQ